MLEDRSGVRVRSLGRKGKLILTIIVFGMGLALFLKVFSIFSPHILSALTNSVLSFLGGAAFLTIVVTVSLSLLLVSGKRRLANCRLRRLLLPSKRTNMMIPTVSGDGSTLAVNCGDKKGGDGFAISMLRLLSVPREGVRQRVRGAVARDEQEEGAAVSDEKQYQFSHLESLSKSEGERCMTYEVQFRRGLVNVGFTVSSEDGAECGRRSEQVKANVLSKFPIQLVEASGERLKNAALMGLPWGASQVEAASNKAARVSSRDFSGYVAVVALRGRPEMAAHEQRCQIDQLITGVNSALKYRYQGGEKEQLVVSLVVSFEASKPPKYPSDASLREKLRDKPEVKLSLERKKVEVDAMEVEFGHRTGWWKVSTYTVIVGRDRVLVEEKADSVANIMRSVWSGSHFSPECTFLHSKEVVKQLPVILRRGLLPKRYVTGMSSVRLSSLVHIPEEAHPPLTKVTPPPFDAPDPTAFRGDGDVDSSDGGVTLGDVLSPVGGILYPLMLPVNNLGTHVVVFGESGFGKTCLIIVLLVGLLGGNDVESVKHVFGGRVPFLVLDQKGEYRCLIVQPEYGIAYFLPASEVAPLWINLFDPQGDNPDAHAKRVFNIIREVLFANRTELTPQMERVLYDVLRMNIGGDWATFNVNLTEYLRIHGGELPQLEATIQGILNRVGQFTRPPLDSVFNCKESNVYFPNLVERSAVIDLSEVRRHGTPEDVRLVANIIGKYVSVASLNRGADFGGELKHLFIVDDALDVVPEVLTKKTTADVGTIEYMAILLRATGQGLVVVSQRPNIAENVMGNSAVKVFFRTVVDARELATWVNMSEEQAAYLKVLPKQEAVISVPQHSTPLRIRIPEVSNIVKRKVTNHDIIVNNMINYPLMYDMQGRGDEEGRQKREETEPKTMTETEVREERRSKQEEEVKEEKKEQGEGKGKDGEEEKERREEDLSRQLDGEAREAWLRLESSLIDGWAVDSEFVACKLGVSSQREAHRVVLSLRRAGLVGFTKIPNYAFGKGTQYAYYCCGKDERERGLYGSGVIGYVRERIHSDLTGREVIVQVSPRDVPSADMVIGNSFPLIIHLATEKNLRLSALRDRIQRVVDEFNSSGGGNHLLDTVGGGVILVTLWGSTARLLNERRNDEILGGTQSRLLCVIPFSRRWVNMLADYVLHHITLKTLLTGEEEEQEEEREREEGRASVQSDVEGEVRGGQGMMRVGEGREGGEEGKGGEDRGDRRRVAGGLGDLRERVLGVVRELGGVEPRVVAERLGVSLPRVSEAVKVLVEKGLVKVARNVPDLRSRTRANISVYLDSGKVTALHDVVMNDVWKRNIELGGKSRDYSFEYGDKTWHTDGLLENAVKILLEVAAGEYSDSVLGQVRAYTAQLDRDRSLQGVVIVVIENRCLERLRREALSDGIPIGIRVFITSLRSKDERLQFESLLKHGNITSLHRNRLGAGGRTQ